MASYRISFSVLTPTSFLAMYHVEPHGALRLTTVEFIIVQSPLLVVEISREGLPTLSSFTNLEIVGEFSFGSKEQKGFGNAFSNASSRHFSSSCFLKPEGTSLKSSIGTISPLISAFCMQFGSSSSKSLCSPEEMHKSAFGIFLGMYFSGLSMKAGSLDGSGSSMAALTLRTKL